MSRPHLIMFCYGVFILGTLLSLACSARWFEGNEIDPINQLAGFTVVNINSMGGWGVIKPLITFFGALVTMLTWNYPFLEGSWGWIFKAIFLYPVTIGVVLEFIEGSRAVLQGIASTIRSLLP